MPSDEELVKKLMGEVKELSEVNRKLYACLDIGGTKIKHGVIDDQGNIIEQGSCATEAFMGAEHIVKNCAVAVEIYKLKYDLSGIAVSTAGVVNTDTGSIIFAGKHLPGYTGLNLKQRLEAQCHLKCYVENDVNCAGLGEYWLGRGQQAKSLVVLTLGTNIGGCIIIDGKLYHGAGYAAGEFGLMPVKDGMTFQERASARVLIEKLAKAKDMNPQDISLEQFAQWYQEEDVDALNYVPLWERELAHGLAQLCCVLNPEKIIIGGGISEYGELLLPGVQREMARVLEPALLKNTEIAFAGLANNAGMLGALYNFLSREREGM